jgi:hypothetical protein
MKVLLSILKFLMKTLIFDWKSVILPRKLLSRDALGRNFRVSIKGVGSF